MVKNNSKVFPGWL